MATSTLIPITEYLSTVYRPDCDYVDGEVQERNLGEFDHGNLQTTVVAMLYAMRRNWHIRAVTELRVQVGPTRFRIPDVCVLSTDAPKEQIVRHPPLLCIEILSPEDRMSRVRERIADFIRMGVREVWVFDPGTRTAMVCDGVTTVEHTGGRLSLPGTPIGLDLAEVFSALDED